MKILKMIGLGLLGLIVALVVIGFFLPSTSVVERSMVINATPAVVFDQVNTLKNWEKWSPWKDMDPEMVNTYGDLERGVGAYYSWVGPKSGEGKLTITEIEENKLVKSDLDFGEMGIAKCDYMFEPAENGTKMTWKFESEMGGNPLNRWIGVMMKGTLEEQFDLGMNKMNSYIENVKEENSQQSRIEGISIMDMDEMHYLAIRDTANASTIGQKIAMYFGKLNEEIADQNLEIAGAPFTIYYSDSNTDFDFDTAMPLKAPGKANGNIISATIPAGKAVVVSYYGPYELTGMAHEAANKYISNNNDLTISGPPREVYVTDSESEPDPANWLTQVIYPVN
jgi:effector-binding domain-containing protein